MVDRFVSGIDESSQSDIEKFCRDRLSALHSELIKVLGVDDPDEKRIFEELLEKANKEYIRGLNEDGFGPIKRRSRAEMEGMVEFMPKNELAQMAESLVELTSIKRRVSRGFETVGGPIDVAVISRSDGFVWIKRKHYFPPELNARFFERVRTSMVTGGSESGDDKQAASVGGRAGGAPSGSARTRRRSQSASRRDVVEQESSSRAVQGDKKDQRQTDQ